MSPVQATARSPRGAHYRRPGGPWDGPDLDALLTTAAPTSGAPRDALVDGDIRLSAADVDDLAATLAGGLRERGVRRRSVVAWQLPNGYEAVLLFRACWRLGAVAVPIHHRAGEAEVAAALDRVDPDVVVGAAHLPLGRHPDAVVVGGPTLPARRTTSGTAAGRDAATGRPADPFARLLAGEPVRASAAAPSDVAAVLFTAGSTGGAKGVVHTRRTLAAKARSMPARHGLGPADTVLMPAPLAHISGLLNGLLVPTVAGMTTVMMAVWQPALALELIERERVSFMVGPPTFFHALAAESTFHPRRVRSLRLISTGGAGVTPAFVDDAASTFGARVKRAYGSTEAPTVTTCGPDDPPERGRDTDGRAVGDTEVRVVDPDTATDRAGDRPEGVEGEVWVRGPEVAAGYLDAEQTAAAFARGGWFRTGDLGRLDDGWLTITGRRQAVIIRGGENIAIGEVEAALEAHPAVRHAVVLGQPDERLGERVAAFVVLTGTAPFTVADARAWFTDRGLARFKTPEVVVVLSDMPVLAAGKPDRVTLRGLLGDGVDPTP